MHSTEYQSIDNPQYGFSIVEETDKTFSLWYDEFDGGEAAPTDWEYVDTFNTFQEAYDDIIKNYGNVNKI